jgi:3-deoxy-D-manno-octulosonic acid (KDO) 8-phosphate synthase
MTTNRLVRIAGRACGVRQPLLWITGPCVIESHDLTLSIADTLAGYADGSAVNSFSRRHSTRPIAHRASHSVGLASTRTEDIDAVRQKTGHR